MFGKLFFSFLILSLLACADPKYAPTELPTPDPENKLETCLVQFTGGACVAMKWEALPNETSFGNFMFRILGDGKSEEFEETIAVVLWMPGMGHGSSPVTVERIDSGLYRASKVFFTMKGQWEIRFQIKNGDTIKDQAIVSIVL